jgi:preprotein translocase subunit SecF
VYGLIAIVVLVHDVVIPAGFFSFCGLQVDTLFVVGLLTILGVSINDTIVVFDRIRENLHTNETKHIKEDFAHVVGKSINQTFVRSIMTSVTVLIALGALYLFGPEATHTLSIAMFLGMFFGTYSSIFLASPLLVVWNDYKMKKAANSHKNTRYFTGIFVTCQVSKHDIIKGLFLTHKTTIYDDTLDYYCNYRRDRSLDHGYL